MSIAKHPRQAGWEAFEESLQELDSQGSALEQFFCEQLEQLSAMAAQLVEVSQQPATTEADAEAARRLQELEQDKATLEERLQEAESALATWLAVEDVDSSAPEASSGTPAAPNAPRSGDQISQMHHLTELLSQTRQELAQLRADQNDAFARHERQLAQQRNAWLEQLDQLCAAAHAGCENPPLLRQIEMPAEADTSPPPPPPAEAERQQHKRRRRRRSRRGKPDA